MPAKKNKGKPRKNFNRKFKKQRAKRVETKKREHALIAIRNSTNGAGVSFSSFYPDTTKATAMTAVLSMLPVRSFYRTSRGNRPDQMEGSSIYCKNIYMKGKITGLPASNAVEAYIISGIVQDKLGLSEFTSPTVTQATRQTVEDFIYNQVRQHFDEKKDEMRYRTAKKDNIKILSYKKLTHPADAAFNNDIDFKCHWKWNRKVTYTRCRDPQDDAALQGNNALIPAADAGDLNDVDFTDAFKNHTDTYGGDIGQYLPLNSWLPFSLVYVPKFADISPGTLNLQYNDVTYFTG